MRISVNLATQPFVELRLLYAKLRLAIAGLIALAIALGLALHSLNAKARTAQAQMDALKAKTALYADERQRNERRMRQPQNMAVLERSQFLNALFAKKSFSWTAVMMDLERVLPTGVQVTSIDPSVSKEGEVTIKLRVSGERDKAVQLVRNLETSQRFVSPRLSGEAAQTQEQGRGQNNLAQLGVPGGVEFEILSGYNPLPETPVKKGKDTGDDTAAAQGDQAAKTVSRRARGTKSAPVKQRPQMAVPR